MTEWIITSSVLILAVTGLRFALKGRMSLRLQYGLWALVLVRLLVPGSFFDSSLSLMNAVEDVREVSVTAMSGADTVSQILPTAPAGAAQQGAALQETDWQTQYTAAEPQYGAEPESAQPSEKSAISVTDVLRAVWLAGMGAVALALLVSNIRFAMRLRRGRKPVEHKAVLPVYECGCMDTPCMFGLFRPAIYLTPGLEGEPLRHVLEHESTHYRHGDHVWSFLRCVCLTLHWYNPLVWIAAVLSKRDAELACDEAAIKRIGEAGRAEYGRTLIGLTCQKNTMSALLCTATTMTGGKRGIKERINLLVKAPKTAICTLLAVALAAAVLVGCTFTGARDHVSSVSQVRITTTDVQLSVGETVQLEFECILKDGSLADKEFTDTLGLIWYFEGYEDIIDVGGDGVLTALHEGVANVCLKTEDGQLNSRAITVTVGPAAGPEGYFQAGVLSEDYVMDVAREMALKVLSGEQGLTGSYARWRVTELEKVWTYDGLLELDLDVYEMDVELEPEDVDSVIPAGGLRLTDDKWVDLGWKYYLFFDPGSGEYYFSTAENDTYPGTRTFTGDLLLRLMDWYGGSMRLSSSTETIKPYINVTSAQVWFDGGWISMERSPLNGEALKELAGELPTLYYDSTLSTEHSSSIELAVTGPSEHWTIYDESFNDTGMRRTFPNVSGIYYVVSTAEVYGKYAGGDGERESGCFQYAFRLVIDRENRKGDFDPSDIHGLASAELVYGSRVIPAPAQALSRLETQLGTAGLVDGDEINTAFVSLRLTRTDGTRIHLELAEGSQAVYKAGDYCYRWDNAGSGELYALFGLEAPKTPDGVTDLTQWQRSDPDAFTYYAYKWTYQLMGGYGTGAYFTVDGGLSYNQVISAYAGYMCERYTGAGMNESNPLRCTDAAVLDAGKVLKSVSLTRDTEHMTFDLSLALKPEDIDDFLLLQNERDIIKGGEYDGWFRIYTEVVLERDETGWRFVSSGTGGGGWGWGWLSLLDETENIRYGVETIVNGGSGDVLLRFLPTLTLEDWDALARSDSFANISVALMESCTGGDQVYRDLYVMKAAVNTDGAYSELLGAMLEAQQEYDPETYGYCLTQLSQEEARAVRAVTGA